MRRGTLVLVLVAFTLTGGVPGAALAGVNGQPTPGEGQYGNPIEEEGPPVSPPEEGLGVPGGPAEGGLPVTGFQAALVLLGGAGLVAAGLFLRRVARGDRGPSLAVASPAAAASLASGWGRLRAYDQVVLASSESPRSDPDVGAADGEPSSPSRDSDLWVTADADALRAEAAQPGGDSQLARPTIVAQAEREGPARYLLFVPSPSGYHLVERAGSPPSVGSQVEAGEVSDRRLVVSKIGPSPLPEDERPCAYLQRVA